MGWCSDLYLKRTGVAGGRRRNVIAFALLLAAVVLAVPFIDDLRLLVLVFSITLTGIASTTSLNFSLLNDLMPSGQNVAKAMAFVVVGGNLFGMAAPIVTGYVVANSGSYDWAFGIAGSLLLVGALVTLTMTRRPILAESAPTAAAGTATSLQAAIR